MTDAHIDTAIEMLSVNIAVLLVELTEFTDISKARAISPVAPPLIVTAARSIRRLKRYAMGAMLQARDISESNSQKYAPSSRAARAVRCPTMKRHLSATLARTHIPKVSEIG